MRPSLVLTLGVLLAACSSPAPPLTASGPPVSVAPPPSGSLTDARLQTVANDIRELGDNPLGVGAREARAAMFQWISGSPDVSVTLCAPLTEPFTDVRGDTDRILFLSIIFHLAEQKIRAPEASRLEQTETAFSETLDTYERLRSAGLPANGTLDGLRSRQDGGQLEAVVSNALSNC
ncbi:MAG: hypothetical protein AAGI52_01230 [Bacteroidota bacterium]